MKAEDKENSIVLVLMIKLPFPLDHASESMCQSFDQLERYHSKTPEKYRAHSDLAGFDYSSEQ